MTIRPRRSVLYLPGSNARAVEKSRALPVDCVVLDLEDSVAPEAKSAARAQVCEALAAGGFGRRELMVRINGLDTEWCSEDLEAVASARPDALVVPKVCDPKELMSLAARLAELDPDGHVRLWAMLESAAAILNAREIAAVAKNDATRLAVFVMGTNDLGKETRTRLVPGRAPMRPWLMTCLAAARAYGIDIIDGVYNDIADAEGFARECEEARDMGFDGKAIIHPSQIEACNRAFTPSEPEVAQARKIIAAFARPENRGRGAISLEGRMVERLHAAQAGRTIALAEAIEASSADQEPPGVRSP
jgi:citrate lyase subunit beta/citryl-CoA lyase